ncbi:MAG: indole-3-glycerol phosphate synthase TrpC [Cyclobacteriaceae bacterium]|nr:indole-3-glycerol phosphate synthase TrpC [Cyclobacteriaceae bacterium HetDA_MAG_MS6]
MNILDEILANKKKEVEERKALFPVKLLEQSTYFEGESVSLAKYIRREDKVGIIAEIKRRSPSKGFINPHVSVEQVSIGYMQAGASGISVLTDTKYFGGKNEDLTTARSFNFCPILRKDFIIDEYQILEAKSIGADVILLIAAALDQASIRRLSAFAHSLGLEVLLEVHNREELQKSIGPNIDLLGVNNRDLTTFHTDIAVSKSLAEEIPQEYVKVSESGINDPKVVLDLMKHGFEGFLMGEHFMLHGRPGIRCREFIAQVQALKSTAKI